MKKEERKEESATELVESLVVQAVKSRATDIHFEPESDGYKSWMTVRFRVDGLLRDICKIDTKRVPSESIVGSIKIASGLDTTQRRKGQDGRFSKTIDEKDLDMRVAVMPTITGEKVVLRLIDKEMYFMELEALGMTEDSLKVYKTLISMLQGFILITGPTGCGKTTTLYSTMSRISSRQRSICTIEDPVESRFPGISQTQVDREFGITFNSGLRAIMRQDPDVIMIGEIRDLETAATSFHAALAGYLIFSTLHAKNSAYAITRLIDMGIEPYLISAALSGIISQRLVRLLCRTCKGKGCQFCNDTGFKGRTGIFEVMKVSDIIKELVRTKVTADAIRKAAIEEGMTTLEACGNRLVSKGLTTAEEIARVLVHEDVEKLLGT